MGGSDHHIVDKAESARCILPTMMPGRSNADESVRMTESFLGGWIVSLWDIRQLVFLKNLKLMTGKRWLTPR
jgi:hypothetical protein